MIARPPSEDIPRITLAVLAIGVMMAASVWVMLPFVAVVVWATTIVIATWPVLLWFQARFGGRRGFAVAAMLSLLLGLLVVPIGLGIWVISENADRAVDLAQSLVRKGLPPLPEWVKRIPLAGPSIVEAWGNLVGSAHSLGDRAVPQLGEAARWLASKAGHLGVVTVQFILTVVICGVLYSSGENAARGVLRFLRRLAGERGENAGILAAKAVRAVALGIIVTALVQTALTAIALLLAQMPGAGLLIVVTLVLCIAQLGPILVVAPATIWLYASGLAGRGTVMLVVGLIAVTIDNFLRPVLINRGANLPLLLVFAGVIGGLLGFGLIGLFVGPVVLAVTWTLLGSWVDELDHSPTTQSPPQS